MQLNEGCSGSRAKGMILERVYEYEKSKNNIYTNVFQAKRVPVLIIIGGGKNSRAKSNPYHTSMNLGRKAQVHK
jgi:hypothetical protein